MFDTADGCCGGESVFELLTYVFMAGAITCFLLAMHRIAAGIGMGARVKVLQSDAVTLEPEERERLVTKVKSRALRSL